MMDFSGAIQTLSVAAIPILFAITLHEVAHGWAAKLRGDRTAEMLGRLSLNPIKHIDPVGTVAVPVLMVLTTGFMFGWAKPVPVAFNNLNNPKKDMVFVAFAGPVANVVMALFWAVILKLVFVSGGAGGPVSDFIYQMARIGIFFNVLLAVFNLLPIPPLDGGRVLRGLVNESIGRVLDRLEPFGLIIVVGLLLLGWLFPLVQPAMDFLQRLILALVGL